MLVSQLRVVCLASAIPSFVCVKGVERSEDLFVHGLSRFPIEVVQSARPQGFIRLI